jgi:predicted metalloprotease
MVRFKRDPSGPGRVIDRRGGGGGLIKMGAGGGGIVLLIALAFMLFGGGGGGGMGDLIDVLAPATQTGQEAPLDPAQDPDRDLVAFVGDVLADSQTMWSEIFTEADLQYQQSDLVIFRGATQSGCGGAYAQVGPHYCPPDRYIYMDLDFLEKLQQQFGATGDAAVAYIVAHEVGHHIQNQLGLLEEVTQIQQSDPQNANEAQIDLELQADCFAGVWFSTLRTGESAAELEEGDLAEALNAAAAVGDDHIQETTTGQVNPENWTHGSSEQRYEWLKRGFDTADPSACDTFNA